MLRVAANVFLVSGLSLLAVYGVSEVQRQAGAALAVAAWTEDRAENVPQAAAPRAGSAEALLRIPRLRVEIPVFEGTAKWALNLGAGRIEGSGPLGGSGNAALASHRDGFFRCLKDVRLGDELVLELRDGPQTYVVDEIRIVEPEKVDVLADRGTPSLTLVTCYPFRFTGAAPRRYIVHASHEAAR